MSTDNVRPFTGPLTADLNTFQMQVLKIGLQLVAGEEDAIVPAEASALAAEMLTLADQVTRVTVHVQAPSAYQSSDYRST